MTTPMRADPDQKLKPVAKAAKALPVAEVTAAAMAAAVAAAVAADKQAAVAALLALSAGGRGPLWAAI